MTAHKKEERLVETGTKFQKVAAGNALFAFLISLEMAQGKISSQWDYSQEQAISYVGLFLYPYFLLRFLLLLLRVTVLQCHAPL